jgi:hypothetical protein
MTEIRLFRYDDETANEIAGSMVEREREIQRLVERHMKSFFGIRFVASEHATGHVHGGRIDSLGLAHDGSPIIVEYKRHTNENVVSQALFYRSWLLDHRGDFQVLVQRTLGADAAAGINWSNPRLVCIAADFTKFDEHAVQEYKHPIELIRYRLYGKDLVLFESLTESTLRPARMQTSPGTPSADQQRGPRSGRLLTPAQAAMTRFSTQLLAESKLHLPSHASTRPGFRQFFVATSGVRGLSYAYGVYSDSTRVELYINRGQAEENRRVFEFLRDHKADIERSFGGTLIWEELVGKKACRISSRINAGGVQSNESEWPQAHEVTVAEMVRLQRALQPHIEEADS